MQKLVRAPSIPLPAAAHLSGRAPQLCLLGTADFGVSLPGQRTTTLAWPGGGAQTLRGVRLPTLCPLTPRGTGEAAGAYRYPPRIAPRLHVRSALSRSKETLDLILDSILFQKGFL